MPLFLFFNIAFNIHSHYFCAHEHYQLLLHHNHEEKKISKNCPIITYPVCCVVNASPAQQLFQKNLMFSHFYFVTLAVF